MIAFQIVITDYQNGRVVGSMESYEQAPTEVEKSVYDRFEFLFELMTTKPAKVETEPTRLGNYLDMFPSDDAFDREVS